jgi:hypothetical protein
MKNLKYEDFKIKDMCVWRLDVSKGCNDDTNQTIIVFQ